MAHMEAPVKSRVAVPARGGGALAAVPGTAGTSSDKASQLPGC